MYLELSILIVTLVVVYACRRTKKQWEAFEKKGIPFVKPIWPFGSNWKSALLLEHGVCAQQKMYKEMEAHKVFAYGDFNSSLVMVKDAEYVQRMFTTDFSHFTDRFIFRPTPLNSPLEGHLFTISGAKWKYLRSKLSPIFSSGKLKWMFEEMTKCVDTFSSYLGDNLSFGEDIDMKEDCQGFTTEVISSCAFGVESKTIGNPDAEFRKFTRAALSSDSAKSLKNKLRSYSPMLYKLLRLKFVPQEVEDFMSTLVKQTFDHRLKTGYERNDFIQLLLQLREKGSVDFDVNEKDEHDEDEKKHWDSEKSAIEQSKEVFELNDGVLSAQLYVFLVAGFETTASTMYHLMYMFSKNLDCQEKARQEVKDALAKYGEVSYEMLKNLPYLLHCIEETLRLFPPLPLHFRFCGKDYTFPNGVTIPMGTMVIIPTYSMHRDPKYFPEPEKFKPERFEGEIVKGSYSPFGQGPRMCIGKRFALVEIQLVMARFLTQFRIHPNSQPNDDLTLEPTSFMLSFKKGLKVKIEKIK